MHVLKAATAGLSRVLGSPLLVVTLWLLTLVVALPLTVAMEESMRTDIGSSQVEQELRGGLDLGWLEEFHYRNDGLARLLTPGRVGPVMAWENLELWFSGDWLLENRQLAATGVFFLLLWILIQGGLIRELSRPDSRFQIGSFLGASGTFFLRFIRIAAIAGFAYYGVYRLAFWLFPAIERWTQDVTAEKTALGFHLVGAGLIVLLMTLVHLISEYAKIATVQEDRRSAILAMVHSLVKVLRHPLQCFGLMGVFFLALAIAQWLLYLVLPDARNASVQAVVLAFFIGQIYLLARTALRLARFSAEIKLYNQWRAR
jgi:hypothetical protein